MGAFFDDNYLLTGWESSKTMLINPAKSDDSAFDSVKTYSRFSTMGEKLFPRLNQSDLKGSTTRATQANLHPHAFAF